MQRDKAKYSPLRWALLAALGVAGVVVAHAVSYWLAYRDPHGRELAFAAAGHGYWALAAETAALGVIVALLGQTVLGAFGGHTPSASDERPTLTGLFVRLSAVQFGVFGMLEVGERLAEDSGMPWPEVAFWLGLPIQLLVAGLGALALHGAEQVGTRLARGHRFPEPKRPVNRLLPSCVICPRSREPGGKLSARAPPTMLLSA